MRLSFAASTGLPVPTHSLPLYYPLHATHPYTAWLPGTTPKVRTPITVPSPPPVLPMSFSVFRVRSVAVRGGALLSAAAAPRLLVAAVAAAPPSAQPSAQLSTLHGLCRTSILSLAVPDSRKKSASGRQRGYSGAVVTWLWLTV